MQALMQGLSQGQQPQNPMVGMPMPPAMAPPEPPPLPMLHNVTVVRRKSYGCARTDPVPSEEFGITRRAKLGDKATTSTSSLILEAQFEIAAAALVSGLTNVVTLASGGGGQQFGKFPEFNIPDLHGIGHGNAQMPAADFCAA